MRGVSTRLVDRSVPLQRGTPRRAESIMTRRHQIHSEAAVSIASTEAAYWSDRFLSSFTSLLSIVSRSSGRWSTSVTSIKKYSLRLGVPSAGK